MDATRYLLVVADDYGIGPDTSQGILDLARQRCLSSTVLLVNSPYAEQAVRDWHRAGRPVELGWHPCLNLDRPVLAPGRVPSLVGADGSFLPLGTFLRRAFAGRVRPEEVVAELRAQYDRFLDLVGHPPAIVNAHKHLQVFRPVGAALLDVLDLQRPLPYVRRVGEPWRVLLRVPGGRFKRLVLSSFGRRFAREQIAGGFPGNDWLAGITNPECIADPNFLVRWLRHMPGRVVELACHPGYRDPTLVGRDCPEHELERRTGEMHLLQQSSFPEACRAAGFAMVTAAELAGVTTSLQGSAA